MPKRERKSEDYSKSTFNGISSFPFNRGLQISTDPRFARSNHMLDETKQQKSVSYGPAIEEKDIQGLRSGEVHVVLAVTAGFPC